LKQWAIETQTDDPKVLELPAALLKLASERLNPVPPIEPPERMAAV
jgi:hypothetical protein